jgi:NADH-quinone oxidoreductase subunit G
MSAAVSTEFVQITINDVEIQVPKGELIVESVKRLGLEIPIFCYHPRMKPVGMCRMCLVEVGFKQADGSVRKMPKPQAGCTLPASEGMVIFTDTKQVHIDRKGVLEFLLINHPLDCPICDRGGECPLQNNTLFYGPSTSRFTELKRHAIKAYPLSKYVTLDLERCIQCGRCVRFTEEISGDAQLAFRFRGAEMQPSTFQLLDFESRFSGNVIEICPVGALTSAKYRFRARPWDLESKPSTCVECANHCSTFFDYRAGKYVRTNGRTNEAVNEEWTCDKGKFGHDYYNSADRMTQVLVRSGDQFVAGTWSDAYELIQDAFKVGGNQVAALVGGKQSNEALYLLKKAFKEGFGSDQIDHRWGRAIPAGSETIEAVYGSPSVQSKIADLESAKTIFLFGGNVADEQPMVYLRARKAATRFGANVVVIGSEDAEADRFASQVVRYNAGTEYEVSIGLLLAAQSAGITLPEAAQKLLSGQTAEFIQRVTGVSSADFTSLISQMGADAIFVTSDSLFKQVSGDKASLALAGLAKAQGVKFNQFATIGNAEGARSIGLMPGPDGRTTTEILEACTRFEIKALWLVDCDPFALHADQRLVMDAIESVDFLIVQGSIKSDLASYASLVLPNALPAEQTGTYTNIERRVQSVRSVIPAPGDAKAGWRIFAELLMRVKPGKPLFSPEEVFAAIEAEVPSFKGALASGDPEGFVIPSEVHYQVVHA